MWTMPRLSSWSTDAEAKSWQCPFSSLPPTQTPRPPKLLFLPQAHLSGKLLFLRQPLIQSCGLYFLVEGQSLLASSLSILSLVPLIFRFLSLISVSCSRSLTALQSGYRFYFLFRVSSAKVAGEEQGEFLIKFRCLISLKSQEIWQILWQNSPFIHSFT